MTREQLHHHVEDAVGEDIDVVDACNVHTLKARGDSPLEIKSRQDLWIRRVVRIKNLDRDTLVEALLNALVNNTHAALRDDADNRVLASDCVPNVGQHRRRGGRHISEEYRSREDGSNKPEDL